MSFARFVVIASILSLASAATLAVASLTPGSIRGDEPPPDATDPAHGARFTEEQIARHGRYRADTYLSIALFSALQLVVLVMLARGPVRRSVEALGGVPGGWVTTALILAAGVAVVMALVDLPLAYVRGFAMERAWGLSTQDVGGWLSDRLKSTLVGAATLSIAALAFFGAVRAMPRLWWVAGWLIFSLLTAAMAFLWPVLIAPLFNDFTPLDHPSLEARIRSMSRAAGVDVDRILVADASRRTTAENAYVAGLGGTKRIVLYDTLLRGGSSDETALVVAHELGHEAENHVLKNVLLSAVGLLAGFAFLAWLATRPAVWEWAGAPGIGDLRALPLLLLVLAVGGLVTLPLQSAVSRAFERRADVIALDLTGDPATFVRVMRRLAYRNLADLRPPPAAVWAFYSHPPIPERIEVALSQRARSP